MAMMLRIRGPSGMARLELPPSATLKDLLAATAEKLQVADEFCLELNGRNLMDVGMHTPLAAAGLKRGDLLQFVRRGEVRGQQAVSTEPGLDEVDKILSKQTGLVPRNRDAMFCQHGPEGRCIHCMPLEPYDEAVLTAADPPIKFLSFQSYLRKLNSGADHGRLTKLETLDCKIKPCNAHPPYPRGICTRCQPSAITLQRQSYRHVDYVQFEAAEILNDFISAWRALGHQRVGYLYGRYEVYDQVPLGVKAVVAAIYEPPQAGSEDGLELLDDPDAETIELMAATMGLVQVGWVFTDLEVEDLRAGTVKYKRYITLQNAHPNPVPLRYADSGMHGSKYVSVVVSGAEDNTIVPNAYQASTQAMALVRDDILRPSDSDKLMAVKPSSDEEYVPDIFFVEKDKYGNQIKQSAKPTFPTEYLMVDLPAGANVGGEDVTFARLDGTTFPIENRESLGQAGTLRDIARRVDAAGASFLAAMADFHLQRFMATDTVLAMLRPELPALWEAIRDKDEAKAQEFSKSEQWATVMLLAQEAAPTQAAAAAGGAGSSGAAWTCPRCTLHNAAEASVCGACNGPRP